MRERFRDWERRTENTVAALRALVGPDLDDPALTELVGEMSLKSDRFRRLWARHDVRPRISGTTVVHHPQVGPLELRCEKLGITGSDRQVLVAYHAEPESASARGLALLGTLAGDAGAPATAAATT